MADTKISALTAASALDGTEQIPGVQSSGNVKITPNQISTFLGGLQSVTIAISSAEILALNGTPKVLIVAPGANKAVNINRVIIDYDFVTTAYDTFTTLAIEYGTAEVPAVADNTILGGTEDKVAFLFGAEAVRNRADIVNKEINVTVESGDPLNGDGTLSITAWYEIVDI